MTTTLTNMSCGGCGRPTPYRIVIADEAKPCCGRLGCEAWARVGVRRASPPAESVLIAVREERRRYDALLVRVLEGLLILEKGKRREEEAEIWDAVMKQLRRDLLEAIATGAAKVAA